LGIGIAGYQSRRLRLPILEIIGKFWGLAPFLKGLWNRISPNNRHIIAKLFIPS